MKAALVMPHIENMLEETGCTVVASKTRHFSGAPNT
jgi:hypothetical protein